MPEHIALIVPAELKTGIGLITTVTSCVFVQPFAVRANTYVTVSGLAVELVSVSLIDGR